MLIVGIDISKYKHDCCILQDSSSNVIDKFTFKNNTDGFNLLISKLKTLEISSNIKIGFESTSHYAINLKLFLEKNNFTFMEFNPYNIARYSNSFTLRKTKTDKIDCETIAKWLLNVEYKPYPHKFYHIYSLKSYTRLRHRLVTQRSKYIVEITNILDHIFPEFKGFFSDSLCSTAIFILDKYKSAEKISEMDDNDYLELCHHSRNHFTRMKFIELKNLAKNTVGETDECFEFQLQSIISLYKTIDKEIDSIESNIKKCIRAINPKCLTIPGIGEITSAIIYTEYGGFEKFDNPGQMLAFAGLEPGIFQSGTSEYDGHMVKHGSSHLRNALMNSCMTLILNNDVFAEYYRKKISEGKHHLVACSHLVKKLLRIIFILEKKQIDFDYKLAF